MGRAWPRHDVAIGLIAPPPIIVANAVTAGHQDGAAKFWAAHVPEHNLLILRGNVPVRYGVADPGRVAAERTVAWWRERLFFVTLATRFEGPIWTWDDGGDWAPPTGGVRASGPLPPTAPGATGDHQSTADFHGGDDG